MVGRLASLQDDQTALLRAVDDLQAAWRPLGGVDDAGVVGRDLAALRDALAARTVSVGVFGLIKRGKSTLVNALVGAEVSATRVVPETAVPVTVRYAPDAAARVHLADGTVREATVDEARACSSRTVPSAIRGRVTHVEQRTPAEFLRQGVELLDTPGLDEAEADELYTKRTLQHLERVDAGLVAFQAPPTVGAVEMQFLGDLLERHARKTVVVCNLYPGHFADASERDAIVGYVRDRLAQAGAGDLHLVPVCAARAWRARQAGDESAWEAAGGAALLATLEDVAAAEAHGDVVEDSVRELERIVAAAERWVAARRQVLEGASPATVAAPAADGLDGASATQVDRATAAAVEQVRTAAERAARSARRGIEEARDHEGLEAVLERYRLALEVRAEEAGSQLTRRLAPIARGLRQQPTLTPTTATTEPVPAEPAPDGDAEHRVGGATVGGLVTGGVGLAVLGLTIAPVGLIAGAVAGWRLSSVFGGGDGLRQLRRQASERLDEVAGEVVASFATSAERLGARLLDNAEERTEATRVTRTRLLKRAAELPAAQRREQLADCDELVRHLARLRRETDRTSTRSSLLGELSSLS